MNDITPADALARHLPTDPTLVLLFRAALDAYLDDADPELGMSAWLESVGYHTTPGAVLDALNRRRQTLGYWAGRYTLFIAGVRGPTLVIDDSGATLDGRRLVSPRFADDVLAWRAEDDNPSSARLSFVMTPRVSDEGVVQSWPDDGYRGPQCAGTFWKAGEPAPDADDVRGKVRMFTSDAALSESSADSLDYWHGEFDLTVSGASCTLEIDATTNEVRLDGETLKKFQFAQNILQWSASDGNTRSGHLELDEINFAQTVMGWIWTGTTRPASQNVKGRRPHAAQQLSDWIGTYATERRSGDAWARVDAADDLLLAGDPITVTLERTGCADFTYHTQGGLLTWDAGAKNDRSGSLAFTVDGTSKRFSGTTWAPRDPRPDTPNVRGTLRPPPDSEDDDPPWYVIVGASTAIFGGSIALFMCLLNYWDKCCKERREANEAAARGERPGGPAERRAREAADRVSDVRVASEPETARAASCVGLARLTPDGRELRLPTAAEMAEAERSTVEQARARLERAADAVEQADRDASAAKKIVEAAERADNAAREAWKEARDDKAAEAAAKRVQETEAALVKADRKRTDAEARKADAQRERAAWEKRAREAERRAEAARAVEGKRA